MESFPTHFIYQHFFYFTCYIWPKSFVGFNEQCLNWLIRYAKVNYRNMLWKYAWGGCCMSMEGGIYYNCTLLLDLEIIHIKCIIRCAINTRLQNISGCIATYFCYLSAHYYSLLIAHYPPFLWYNPPMIIHLSIQEFVASTFVFSNKL